MENKMNGDLSSPLRTWIELFVRSIPQLAKDTRVLYQYTVLRFVIYWEKVEGSRKCWPVTVKQETIATWLKRVNANGFPSTVVLQAGILNRFLSFLKKMVFSEKTHLSGYKSDIPKED